MPIINPTLPNDGEDADAADVNTPFQAILALLNGGIDADNIVDEAITAQKLHDNAVTAAKILDSAVTAAKIADSAVTNNKIGDWDGWIKTADTWTYVSASTFTISGDQTVRYHKGTRLKWTQTTAKYGVVVGVAYSAGTGLTTVTIAVNTDYVITNAAITANYYSYGINPQGYPSYFNYTPTATNFSGGTWNEAKFAIIGETVFYRVKYTLGGAGVSGVLRFTVPGTIGGAYTADFVLPGTVTFVDAGTAAYLGQPRYVNTTLIELIAYQVASTYLARLSTSSTVPFTWGNTDMFIADGWYQLG